MDFGVPGGGPRSGKQGPTVSRGQKEKGNDAGGSSAGGPGGQGKRWNKTIGSAPVQKGKTMGPREMHPAGYGIRTRH